MELCQEGRGDLKCLLFRLEGPQSTVAPPCNCPTCCTAGALGDQAVLSVRCEHKGRTESQRDAGLADRSITASTSVRKAESQRAGFLTCSQMHSYAAHLWRTALSQRLRRKFPFSYLKPEPRFREQEREFPTWLPRASLTSGHSLLLRRAKYVLLQAFLHKAS